MAAGRVSIHTVAFLAAACCFLVYLRALGCGYVWFDDPDYVFNNQAIRSLDWQFIHWAFTSTKVSLWMPLTWISLAVDYHFWGLSPFGYHLTNVVLHAANVFLVVLLADRLCQPITGQQAEGISLGNLRRLSVVLTAALIFGIHPLRVESVAWITERKDVLNGIFSLGALLCYLGYTRKMGGESGRWWYYGASLACFVCSLMVKPVSVALPFMMLVLDWYPLARLRGGAFRWVLLEKAPFVFLSGTMVVLSLVAATQQGSFTSAGVLPFATRCLVAGNGLFEYCRLTLFPIAILPFYPLNLPIPASFTVKTVVMLIVTAAMLCSWRRRPWLAAGWLLFVLPLLPVLGFFQNGEQAFAARFTYLGSMIPAIFVAAVAERSTRNSRVAQRLLLGGACLLVMLYGGITQRLIPVWDNPGTFWSRIIDVAPLGRAYQERGLYYHENGNAGAAADDLAAAVEIARASNMLGFNLLAHRGMVLLALKRYEESAADFSEAIAMHPAPRYYYHRGLALRGLGRIAEAQDDFRRAGSDRGPITWIE